jgi:acylphosphatase
VTAARRTVRYLVSGRVQGVFYRASAAAEARRLGVDGWARNLSDGRVEVVASGDDAALSDLADWLWRGSPAASVDGVDVALWTGEAVPAGFETR